MLTGLSRETEEGATFFRYSERLTSSFSVTSAAAAEKSGYDREF